MCIPSTTITYSYKIHSKHKRQYWCQSIEFFSFLFLTNKTTLYQCTIPSFFYACHLHARIQQHVIWLLLLYHKMLKMRPGVRVCDYSDRTLSFLLSHGFRWRKLAVSFIAIICTRISLLYILLAYLLINVCVLLYIYICCKFVCTYILICYILRSNLVKLPKSVGRNVSCLPSCHANPTIYACTIKYIKYNYKIDIFVCVTQFNAHWLKSESNQ